MFYRFLFLILALIPQTIHANFWVPPLSFFTKARFIIFDIWWIMITMLIEIAVFKFFIKKYPLKKIVIGVLLANILSIAIGVITFFIQPLQAFSIHFMMKIDDLLFDLFGEGVTTPVSNAAILTGVIFKILVGIVINTVVEYPAYYFYLKSVKKRKLFFVTLFSNVLSNIFMAAILIFSLASQGILTGKQTNFSVLSFIEKMYKSDKNQEKSELPKKSSRRRRSRSSS